MKMTLQKLILHNFKGLTHFEYDFNGRSATIQAENGIGKTTLYDAITWLLYDTDSLGRTRNASLPVNWPTIEGGSNDPVTGITSSVEAWWQIDGNIVILKKETVENIVKSHVVGYDSSNCWINDVPTKKNDFKKYIEEDIAPARVFKLLTDMYYLHDPAKFDTKKRRLAIAGMAGPVPIPSGFGTLLSTLNGRTMEQYKKLLTEQKEKHQKALTKIEPALEEKHRDLSGYVPGDTQELEHKRDQITETMEQLDHQRDTLRAENSKRQKFQSDINTLEVSLTRREVELENDLSGVEGLLEEKRDEQRKLLGVDAERVEIEQEQTTLQANISGAKTTIDRDEKTLQAYRTEITQIEHNSVVKTKCYACGQELPKDQIIEQKQKIVDRLNELNTVAAKQQAAVETARNVLRALTDQQDKLNEKLATIKTEAEKVTTQANKRIQEIEKQIEERPKPDPAKDEIWKSIKAKIAGLQSELGPSISDQLSDIEQRRDSAADALAQINKSLNNVDRAKQDKARIKELETQQSELAQKIVEVDGKLEQIRQFNYEQGKLIEVAVNCHFKHVTWKLFNVHLNGEIDTERCDCLYNGRLYPGTSKGEKMLIGQDCYNAFSKHYDFQPPLFIDDAGDLTLPIEAETQVIKLKAAEGIKQLQISCEDHAERKELVA